MFIIFCHTWHSLTHLFHGLQPIDFSTLRMCSDKGKMLHFNGGVKPWTWQTNYADHKLPLCVTYLETWHLGGGKILLFCFLLELWVDSGGCVSKLATSIDFCPWKQLFDKGFAQGGWGKRGRWWLILFDTPRSEICGISTVIHNLLSSGPTFTSVLQGGAGKYAWELQHQVSSWSSLDALTWMKSDLLLW